MLLFVSNFLGVQLCFWLGSYCRTGGQFAWVRRRGGIRIDLSLWIGLASCKILAARS